MVPDLIQTTWVNRSRPDRSANEPPGTSYGFTAHEKSLTVVSVPTAYSSTVPLLPQCRYDDSHSWA